MTAESDGQESMSGTRSRTGRLLTCGIVAGPLFLLVWLIQVVIRAGFDPVRHPISLLSLGELGWIQVANFVVTGALLIAAAAGARGAMHPGVGSTWGPLLLGVLGAGLVVAGIFPTDAGAGFPLGAPTGAPETSWHGVVHEIGFGLASVSWTACCLVFARRFAAIGHQGWMISCIAFPLAALLIMAWPDLDSLSLRLVLATAIEFAFVAAIAIRLRREVRSDLAAGPAGTLSGSTAVR